MSTVQDGWDRHLYYTLEKLASNTLSCNLVLSHLCNSNIYIIALGGEKR